MKAIVLTLMLGVAAVTCGCSSAKFHLSQSDGLLIEVHGAMPTMWKFLSSDKVSDDEKSFDLFHFEALPVEDEEGAGTVLAEPEVPE